VPHHRGRIWLLALVGSALVATAAAARAAAQPPLQKGFWGPAQIEAQRRSNLVIGGNTHTTGEIRPATGCAA